MVCTVVAQMIVVVFTVWRTGDVGALFNQSAAGMFSDKSTLYWLLGVSSVGTFLLPAWILQRIERKQGLGYWMVSSSGLGKYFLLLFLFLLSCQPLMELISAWNMDMRLPEALRDLEQWMRRQEDQMALLTKELVMITRFDLLLLNLLVMAVIPAIVEEIYFRGVLQHIMVRMFRNGHVAIWVTAIIFSAIHVQFYGFFPRLLLGLFFGYAYVWSRSIWVPIFGHFVNNATVTVLAFLYAREGRSFEALQQGASYSILIYGMSFVAACAIGYYFYNVRERKNEQELGEA